MYIHFYCHSVLLLLFPFLLLQYNNCSVHSISLEFRRFSAVNYDVLDFFGDEFLILRKASFLIHAIAIAISVLTSWPVWTYLRKDHNAMGI